MRVTVVSDAEAAAQAAAELFADEIDRARETRGRAHVALAGGDTPRGAYEWLVFTVDDWTAVELWFGDERAVAIGDPRRNETMVAESFVEPAGIAAAQVHPMPASTDPAEAAAYADLLRERVPPEAPGGPPALDLAILGMGEDGHICSLFPGHPALDQEALVVEVTDAPQPPHERVTLTIPALRAARRLVILVTGEGKRAALAAARDAAGPDPSAPASLLRDERTEVIADAAAAG